MSLDAYASLSDRDLGDSVAYLKSLPPVDRESPQSYGRNHRAFIAGRSFFVSIVGLGEVDEFNRPRPRGCTGRVHEWRVQGESCVRSQEKCRFNRHRRGKALRPNGLSLPQRNR